MKATIKNIKTDYSIDLPKNILQLLKVREDEDVEVDIIDNELIINNVKIKPLSLEERLNIRSIKNGVKKLDWGEI